jgi:hypothetical protein
LTAGEVLACAEAIETNTLFTPTEVISANKLNDAQKLK